MVPGSEVPGEGRLSHGDLYAALRVSAAGDRSPLLPSRPVKELYELFDAEATRSQRRVLVQL